MTKRHFGAKDMVMITPDLIKVLRQAMGLSAEAFADRLGVTASTVFNWEAGRRHPKYDMQIELNRLLRDAEKNGLLQPA